MRHPFTRAERRFARAIARERYRVHLRTFHYYPGSGHPEEDRAWNRGGKQCEAHGNRCWFSMMDRNEIRREVKALRRLAVIL